MRITKKGRQFWDTLKFSYDRGEVIRKNPEILKHVIISKQLGRVTEPLGNFIIYAANRYGGKPNFYSFTYKDDMIAHAIMQCMISVMNFNPSKSDNPFAYIIAIINGAFIYCIHKERRERTIKEYMAEQQKIILEENTHE